MSLVTCTVYQVVWINANRKPTDEHFTVGSDRKIQIAVQFKWQFENFWRFDLSTKDLICYLVKKFMIRFEFSQITR